MMKKISRFALIIILVVLVLPNVSFAQYKPGLNDPNSPTFTESISSGWDSFKGFFGFGSSKQTAPPAASTLPQSGNIYQGGTGIGGLFAWILGILRLIFPLIVSAAIVWFVYNVFQYTIYDTEKDKKEVRDKLVWGIVTIFIMMSVWGLVNILQSTFRLNNAIIKAPGIQTSL